MNWKQQTFSTIYYVKFKPLKRVVINMNVKRLYSLYILYITVMPRRIVEYMVFRILFLNSVIYGD